MALNAVSSKLLANSRLVLNKSSNQVMQTAFPHLSRPQLVKSPFFTGSQRSASFVLSSSLPSSLLPSSSSASFSLEPSLSSSKPRSHSVPVLKPQTPYFLCQRSTIWRTSHAQDAHCTEKHHNPLPIHKPQYTTSSAYHSMPISNENDFLPCSNRPISVYSRFFSSRSYDSSPHSGSSSSSSSSSDNVKENPNEVHSWALMLANENGMLSWFRNGFIATVAALGMANDASQLPHAAEAAAAMFALAILNVTTGAAIFLRYVFRLQRMSVLPVSKSLFYCAFALTQVFLFVLAIGLYFAPADIS